ncbi:MAG: acyltransferase family protein [Prevotella sp.]|nr:acyltransferase family protein [Prevotella sp.]
MKSKIWLNEVSFMRPILLILLVTYHAFAPYCGAWIMPDGINEVELYDWVALLTRAFRLEGFVFVSGYIFTFQILAKHKFDTAISLFRNKFQRLIIPGIIFGALYYYLFREVVHPYWKIGYEIVSGVGHLWYLPCLFWCFMVQYWLLSKQQSRRLVVLLLFILCFLSFLPLPLQLGRVFYYMLFFYGGGIFYEYSYMFRNYATGKIIVMAWGLFTLLFFLLNIFMDANRGLLRDSNSFILKVFLLGVNNLSKALLGWSGIIALYLSSILYCAKHHIGSIIILIGSCGYGVYVIHQFVLVYLYRYTSFPQITGTMLMPWVALVITIVVSLLLTMGIRKTSFGRKYL